MSLDLTGATNKLYSSEILILVYESHKLIKLANAIPWEESIEIVLPDLLTSTAKGFPYLGRKLFLRIHLAIFFLQKILDERDRKIIERIQDTPVYQVFCGSQIIPDWNLPVHQKIEEFRNRLKPDTQRRLVNFITEHAVKLNLISIDHLKIDSTVQEANMAYPSDASLMKKLSLKVMKIIHWISKKTSVINHSMEEQMSKVATLARSYFFLAKNIAKEKRNQIFEELHTATKGLTYQALKIFQDLEEELIQKMPWNIKQSFDQVQSKSKRYLLDVAHYIRTGSKKPGKILSFFLDHVACVIKGKAGKPWEFGREFQIATVGGNMLIAPPQEGIRAGDKAAMEPLLKEFKNLFPGKIPKSVTADKGYFSSANEKALLEVENFSLGYFYEDQSIEENLRLYNTRAGIEPVIGHIKMGGQLGKSRMKSDEATHAAGYGAMLGYNLKKLMSMV